MSLSKKMSTEINAQITAENESAYIYKAMAYKLESMNLTVFAKWFHLQATEEQEHAEKFGKYLLDRGAEVSLKAIPAPKANWKSCKEICAETLKHEQGISKRISKLVDLAKAEKDHATDSFLIWFVNEQVEEEANASELLAMVELAGTASQVFMLEGRVWRLIEARG
jgi:ferritin